MLRGTNDPSDIESLIETFYLNGKTSDHYIRQRLSHPGCLQGLYLPTRPYYHGHINIPWSNANVSPPHSRSQFSRSSLISVDYRSQQTSFSAITLTTIPTGFCVIDIPYSRRLQLGILRQHHYRYSFKHDLQLWYKSLFALRQLSEFLRQVLNWLLRCVRRPAVCTFKLLLSQTTHYSLVLLSEQARSIRTILA